MDTPNPEAGIAIGRQAPLAMQGKSQLPVSFERAELFRWMGTDMDPKLEDPYEQIARTQPRRSGRGGPIPRTHSSSGPPSTRGSLPTRSARAVAQSPLVTYPNSNLAGQLRMVGAMIRAELPTRVYYVTLGGFDTHANQAGQHARLLEQVGNALNAFYRDLQAQGNNEPRDDDGLLRVRTSCGSEWIQRNRSRHRGTDVFHR